MESLYSVGYSSATKKHHCESAEIRHIILDRCSGKFVSPENYSHTQQYRLGLRLGLGLGLGLRLYTESGLALALVTLWQYGDGKNSPGATNFPRHRRRYSSHLHQKIIKQNWTKLLTYQRRLSSSSRKRENTMNILQYFTMQWRKCVK